ncbi:hypothetical protein LTS08_008168 [Lithohypha guttulata]|nr:hypothetical protein LTS08_008168 [Lithohypha guttulata]
MAPAQARNPGYKKWMSAIRKARNLLGSNLSHEWEPSILHKHCTSKFNQATGWCGSQNHVITQLLNLNCYLKEGNQLELLKSSKTALEQLNMLYTDIDEFFKSQAGFSRENPTVAYTAGCSKKEDAMVIRAATISLKKHIGLHGWKPQRSGMLSAPSSLDKPQQKQVKKKAAKTSTTKPAQKSNAKPSPRPATSTNISNSFNDSSGSFMTHYVQYSDVLLRTAVQNSSPRKMLSPNLQNTASAITLDGEKEPVIVHKYKPTVTKQEPRDDLVISFHDQSHSSSLPSLSDVSFRQWKQQTPPYLQAQSKAKTGVTKQDPNPLIAPRRPQDELDFGDRIDQALLKIDKWAENWLSGKYKDHSQEEQDLAWQSFEFCLRMPDILDAGVRDVEEVEETIVQIKQEEDTMELDE